MPSNQSPIEQPIYETLLFSDGTPQTFYRLFNIAADSITQEM